jgi:threonyl-tRNA synthetase
VSEVSILVRTAAHEEPRAVTTGTTAADLFSGDRGVVVARVNGQLRDLAHPLTEGDVIEPVTIDSADGLAVLRHSATHVLAQAVQEVNPKARLGIGPPIKDGFYYDFDVEVPFTPEDLKALEKVMQRIIKEGQTFRRRVVSDQDARAELAAEPYKLELIGLKGGSPGQGNEGSTSEAEVEAAADGASVEVGAGELTVYDNLHRDGSLAWRDLCRGPHLPSTRLIGNGFQLMRSAAAYWAVRRTPSCSASTARPGRAGRT